LACNLKTLNLPHGTNKSEKRNNQKMKRDMLSEVSVAVWGVCGVSPEEEKKGCGGKDLRKKRNENR